MKLLMLGTRGVPARYGGFETAVEEIGRRLAARGHEVVVYARDRGPSSHLGMRVVRIPTLKSKYTDTIVHTSLSVAHALPRGADAAFVFNAANAACALPLRLRLPYALHVDGLEWKRAKWSAPAQRYYLLSERLAVATADELIVDSRGIGDYYRRRYGRDTVFIPYGAPVRELDGEARELLAANALEPRRYHLVVARFEPENHVREILQGYASSPATLPLVVVGGAPYSESYQAEIRAIADREPRIRMLGSVWDASFLDALYCGAASYVHGHSVGGTNPSLLRAAGAGARCIVFDVPFNREVIGENGLFFSDPGGVAAAVEAIEADPDDEHSAGAATRADVVARYDWDAVAGGYEQLAERLAARRG